MSDFDRDMLSLEDPLPHSGKTSTSNGMFSSPNDTFLGQVELRQLPYHMCADFSPRLQPLWYVILDIQS